MSMTTKAQAGCNNLPTPPFIGKNHTNKNCMVFLFVRVYWRKYQMNATVEGFHPLFQIKSIN
jgi:hypothetical protein